MPLVSRLMFETLGTKVGRKKRQNTISEEKHVFGTPGHHPGPEQTAEALLLLCVLIEDRTAEGGGAV